VYILNCMLKLSAFKRLVVVYFFRIAHQRRINEVHTFEIWYDVLCVASSINFRGEVLNV
jgi:beta-lactamase regulating signal transducer with metallopeptidase domain